MQSLIKGRVVRIAVDDVNTDLIAPSQYRVQIVDGDKNLTPLRPHVMEAVRPGLDDHVRPGDIFVVGKNYGCGSHREPAVQIFKVWGVQAIIAESAGRIWFRNAIAAGLPVFELNDATTLFDDGDPCEIDMTRWTVSNTMNGRFERSIPAYPAAVMRILEAGGIMPLIKQRLELTPAASQPAIAN
ncbi:MAG: hypothetical protein WDN48_01810 [Pseudolabrys sp.]